MNNVAESNLGTMNIRKLLWMYSLPAIVGTMISSMYNIIDRMFIGQGVGPLAISGLALTFPFMNFLAAFAMLVGAGAASRISIRLGEGDKDRAEKILANALMLTFIISGVVIIISRVFMNPILVLFGGSENTLEYARQFMRIIIPGSILSALNFGFNNIMRASGYPKKAMLTMIICSGINVCLAPLFIFGFHWGIAGAAHATNISYFVGSVWVLTHFMQKKSIIRFHKRNFHLNKQIIKSILNIGMSPFSMMIASSMVIVLLNIALLRHGGDLAVGALGIQNSIVTLFLMFIIGLNQGIQPILGYNYGAQNYDRMFSTLTRAALIATIVTTIGFLLSTFFSPVMVSIFTTDEELKSISANALRISVIMLPLVGSQIVFTSFFQSIGKAKISMLLSLARQVLFLIPAVLILPAFFGLNGVWFSMPVADSLAVVVTSITIFTFIRKFEKQTSYKFRIKSVR